MTALLKSEPKVTFERYEEILAASEDKLEFHDGEIVAMAGGTEIHSLVKSQVVRHLGNHLANRSCRVYDSDMKVKVEANNWAAFPDVSVVCGHSKFTDLRRLSLLNPCLIVEVLSESTAAFDRGKKFWHYRHIESLHTYVLVSTDEVLVEVFERIAEGDWRLRTFEGPDSMMHLENLDISIPLASLYEKTSLDPASGALVGGV